MSAPTISVVIPVYNTQQYIIECINSLVQQTYQDFEVLLVDDGSTDNSAKIITEYIKRNNLSRFHLFSKENGGVSSARNYGISRARGDWLTFIDSDDWVEPEFLQNMIDELKSYPADFCMTGFRRYIEATGEINDSHRPDFAYGPTDTLLPVILFNHPIARLFSRSILMEHNIRFDLAIHFAEDTAFMFDYIQHTDRILVLNESQYVYRVRSGSLTTSTVHPHQKQGISSHAFAFWNSFDRNNAIQQVLNSSYHIAHHVVDSILADVICATLDNDREKYKALTHSPITDYVMHHYRHAQASVPEQVLVRLIDLHMHCIAKGIIKIYYNASINKLLRRILKKGH